MSDARLRSELELDIAAALRQVDRLNADIGRATTQVPVTADTRAVTAAIDAAVQNAQAMVAISGNAIGVTGAIDAAVDNADTAVLVTGDAADVTGSITAAVDAADTAVVVTGDASELTGDVTAAVDAADTTVTVTGSVDQGLRSGVQGLSNDLADATQQAGLLRGSLAAISAAAVLAGLYQAATAASDLGESSSKASIVFGESFGDIEQFSIDAATAVGLSQQAALEAAGTFGNLFQALGATQEVAASLSPQVVTLAGDLASFNNLGVEETLERLRSGLVGEIEPLRGLGISFGAAEVEARAMELGLAAANGEVTEGAKLQARFSLIMEQSTLAQGDFARTSGGLANQQRILNAEFDNAVAAAGEALLPALLELVGVARESLIPAFGELASDVLPPFASIISDLAPLLGSAAQFATALGPPLSFLATVVDAIPTPLLAAVGAMIAFNKAAGLLNIGRATVAVQGLVAAVQSIAATRGVSTGTAALGVLRSSARDTVSSLLSFGLVAAPVGIALAGIADASAKAAERKRILAENTTRLTEALTDEEGALRLTERGLARFLEQSSSVQGIISLSGLTVEQFTAAVLQGEAGQRSFADSLEATGNAGGIAGDFLRQAFEDVQASAENVAEAQIKAASASGAITDAQAEAALSSDDLGAALARLQGGIDRHDAQVAAVTDAYGEQISAAKNLGTAYTTLATGNARLANQIVNLGAVSDASLTSLVLNLDAATLSEDQMGAAAALLGTDVATLASIIAGTTAALDDFVSSALGGLPSISDAFEAPKTAAKSTGGAVRDVSKDVRDMERAVRDAERGVVAANKGVEDSVAAVAEAYEQVDDAIDAVTDANDRLREAEQALIDARQGPSARDLEEGEIDIQQARLASERASLRIGEAEAALNEARAEGDTAKIRRAELDLEDARLAARSSVFKIQDAELALQEIRKEGTDQDAAVVAAERAVADAHDAVAEAADRVLESTKRVTEAQAGVEEATYRVVTAQEALADAHARTIESASGGGGGGGAVEAQRVTLEQFAANLRKQAAETRTFLADLDKIAEAGGQDLAAVLAKQGLEAGGGYARELVAQIDKGNTTLLRNVEAAVDEHNAVISEAEQFLREEFGPAYIASTGLVASLASEALGSNLTFAERTRIAANLAETTLSEEGRAIALIAATEGDRAAKEYARLFKIDDDVLAEGLAVGRTLDTDKAGITPAAGRAADRAATQGWGRALSERMRSETAAALDETGGVIEARQGLLESITSKVGAGAGGSLAEGFEGEATSGAAAGVVSAGDAAFAQRILAGAQAFTTGSFIGKDFSSGLAFGIESEQSIRKIRDAAATAVREAEDAARDEARTRSPSLVWRDLGLDLMSGLADGIQAGEQMAANAAVLAVKSATDVVGAGTDRFGINVRIGGDATRTFAPVAVAVAAPAVVAPVTSVDPYSGGVGVSTFSFQIDSLAVGAGARPQDAIALAESFVDETVRRLGAETGAGQVLRRQRAERALRIKGVRR